MNEISIIGYGALGQQFQSFLNEKDKVFHVFDDEFTSRENNVNNHKFNDYKKEEFNDFYVALGYRHLDTKDKILLDLENLNKNMPFFIHKTAYLNPNSIIKPAVFVYPMCTIDKNVSINNGTLINNSVTISHDTTIGRCCYISPGVIISGNVSIGNYTFIGSGSIISNGIKIGNNVVIGLGTVITKDIPDNAHVIGNPMKILKSPLILI